MAGFIQEWRPASNRNGGRLQIGIPGRFASDFATSWGFANENFANRGALIEAARDVARTIAEKPPIAVRGTKESEL